MQNNREGGDKPQPWDVFRLKDLPPDREGEVKTDWQHCGIAWPMKKGDGFNLDIHFALSEGSRLAIMPRKSRQQQDGGRGNRR